MITLTIFKSDGSVYWVEYFNNHQDCDKWIEEEMKRSYWDAGFTYQKEEKETQNLQEVEQQNQQLLQKKESAKQKLKVLGFTDDEIMAMIGF